MHEISEHINQAAGLRTHGGRSRIFQQKGLCVYAREEYGKKRFKCKVFETSEITKFKRLVLRPIKCSKTDAGIEDFVCGKIAKELNFESLDERPCTLYINGEYWGIYYLQEKADERYLENHFGYEDYRYNIIGYWSGYSVSGNPDNFIQMMNWLANADISTSSNYKYKNKN